MISTPRAWHWLLVVLLASSSVTAALADEPMTVSDQLDALGLATQPGDGNDWSRQNEAETALALKIRTLVSTRPGSAELTTVDEYGRTPLLRAVQRGYAQVAAELLKDETVRAAIDRKDNDGLSPWMAAQFARPMTLASCDPQVLVREAVGLWRPNLRRIGYFQQGASSAFDQIRALLDTAHAVPDLEGAKRQWLWQCPGHDATLAREIDASSDLLATLVTDSDRRLRIFIKRLETEEPRAPDALPPQPSLTRHRPQLPEELKAARAKRRGMLCTSMSKISQEDVPVLTRHFRQLIFKVIAEVQDGVPVAANILFLTEHDLSPAAALTLRAGIYKALGNYRCPGDHIFQQEFAFDYRGRP